VIDGGEALVLAADLEVEEECSRLYDEITTNVGQVDVLVNSAGSSWYGFSDEMPWVEARRMIDLNIKAMANLTLLFLPGMKQRGQGHIVNVSSIAGGIPSQGVALYSATKSFVDAFTTSLHRELRGTGVHVSSVRPGPVRTPFLDPIAAELKLFGIPLKRLAIRPETVAGRIARLIKRPKRVIYLPRILGWFPGLS
jgi:short-subunit dehydrogenase